MPLSDIHTPYPRGWPFYAALDEQIDESHDAQSDGLMAGLSASLFEIEKRSPIFIINVVVIDHLLLLCRGVGVDGWSESTWVRRGGGFLQLRQSPPPTSPA
jgi:hypothetical protein